MSNAVLVYAQEPHKCRRCKQEIKVGEKMIKNTGKEYDCGDYHITTVYLHEKCWQPKRNQNC